MVSVQHLSSLSEEELVSSAPITPPSREARFNVVAPMGGYQRRVTEYVTLQVDHLTLEIEDSHGNIYQLRVYPFNRAVTMDPNRPSVFNINNAMAVYVDKDGQEVILDHPPVSVSLYLNTEVQATGMPAGVLTMWSL